MKKNSLSVLIVHVASPQEEISIAIFKLGVIMRWNIYDSWIELIDHLGDLWLGTGKKTTKIFEITSPCCTYLSWVKSLEKFDAVRSSKDAQKI